MSKNIKLVYMVCGPMTERWNQYYCVDTLSSIFDVEFWNFYNLIDDGYYVPNPLQRDYVVTLKDNNDLKTNLKRLPKDSLIVIEIGFVEKYYNILKQIAEYINNCIIIDFWTYYIWRVFENLSNNTNVVNGTIHNAISKREGLINKIKNTNFFWIVKRLLKCKTIDDLQSVYSAFKCRLKEYKSISIERKCQELFNRYDITYKPFQKYTINHPDYDKYLSIKDAKDRHDRYIVFIADFFPFHPEVVLVDGFDKHTVADVYYKSLNVFFEKLEKYYSCKVVIAEHPSAMWEHNPFDGREIVYYKTAELVRDCIGVCMHASCAFSYVALFNKPLAIITANIVQSSKSMTKGIALMSKALGNEPVNIDNCWKVTDMLQIIPEELRQRYIKTFADADCNKRNEELFKNHFISIHNDIINSKNCSK